MKKDGQTSENVITPRCEYTDDGSQTLLHPLLGDRYHSSFGAVTESMHVFIENGFRQCGKSHLNILEAGFGSGLNAWLTAKEIKQREGLTADYTAVELYPISEETLSGMDYWDDPLFRRIHLAPWEGMHYICPQMRLKKIMSDLALTEFDTIFDLVYWDAFAPDSQPELWTGQLFERLYSSMAKEGIMVTYCCKGDVKRALRQAGFTVSRLPGAPGKRHMLKAVKE